MSGIYSAVLRLGSAAALTGTLYGRVLLVKSLLALPALLIGGLNLTVTSRSMREAAQTHEPAGLVERFRTLVSTEAGALALALVAVAALTAIPPAQSAGTTPSLNERVDDGDLSIEIDISPGKVGLNSFVVHVEENGDPLEGLREVSLQFTPMVNDLPPSEVVLEETGGGDYTVEGAYLSLPDSWQIQVAVRRAGEFDTFANFDFAVGTGATGDFPWNRASGLVLLAAAVAFGAAAGQLLPGDRSILLHRTLPAAGLLILAVFVFFIPGEQDETYVNPIPPNQSSVLEGQAIYRVQCISCHGPAGRGDGPVGLTLQPPPADLYEHTQPGVHPDGRLYDWISFGFGEESVMPRFEKILTEEERWHVVNYIRTFSRPPEVDKEVTP